ncbi:FMN-binding negative transcriptional regulator [Muriicola sp. Z0-33]|uniref:FMN-binding negative transcriptional regulator n=1 Tax=Muriicola sp. Z0-33 TaxID=2816957 RepID=UPI002236FD17|nr:FMN-binding negative transcriptional regulator [Muriicola sp. Z0-33]MCW5517009.1 FMN-binding negative transcriptional regulator [Muriicola sp. Z0-33]
MYIPKQYKHEQLSEVKEFIRENAFAILVNEVSGRPWATHIPLELEMDENGKEFLVGHIAKANPQWQNFDEQKEVLCIFNGPHSYISSSWYKEEEVPTWNYIAVHIYGRLTILDEAAVLNSLHKLVDKYETNSKNPVSLHNMSKNTMRQIKGIVGFKIEIKEVQAAYKLSQGREHDHENIKRELEEKGAASKAIVKAMNNSLKKDRNF